MNRVDANLIESAQMGDLEAFSVIVDDFQDSLYSLSFRFLNDASEAEDAVQETFLRVYMHLPRYDRMYKFSTWIFRIATNVCIDRLRKRKQQGPYGVLIDEETAAKDLEQRLQDHSLSPEEVLLRAETSHEVQRALADLPATSRTVLILRYIQDMSLQEISELLHVPVTTVKSRLHRGREALKQLLIRMPVS